MASMAVLMNPAKQSCVLCDLIKPIFVFLYLLLLSKVWSVYFKIQLNIRKSNDQVYTLESGCNLVDIYSFVHWEYE